MSGESLKLVCVGCGSSLEYSATDRALKCPYCGNVTDIPGAEEEAPNTVQAIVPLTVDVTGLTDAIYQHMASGDMTPDHLMEHASITKKDRFYVPAFCFRGKFEAKWTASFGYDRTEHYTEYESRHENGRTVRVPVNKTRIVTDWRPVNGTDTGAFAVLAYAGAKLLGSSLELTKLVEGGALDAAPYDASYVSGFAVEEFQHTESDIYSNRGQALVNNVIDRSVQRHAQGDRQKDWHWTAEIQRESVTTLVPVCHAIFEFEGKQYSVWLSGFNASRIVADDLPIDNGRRRAVIVGFIPFGAAIVGAGVAIFGMNSPWSLPLEAVAVSLAYGILRRRAIVSYSHKIRQALLTRHKSTNVSGTSATTAAATSKPWLAHTTHDKLLLPLIALAFAVIPIRFAMIRHPSADQQALAQSQPSQTDDASTNSSGQASDSSANAASEAVQASTASTDNSSSVAQSGSPARYQSQAAPATLPQPQLQPQMQPQSPMSSAQSTAATDDVAAAGANPSSAPDTSVSPSFNCARAATPTEYAICDNPSLATLDRRMGQLYEQRVANAPGERARQISWLDTRNATCGADVNCLMAAEHSRIEALEPPARPAETASPSMMQAPSAPASANKPIVLSGPTPTQKIAIKLTEKAEREFGQQNFTAAITNCKAALELRPGYYRARQLLQQSEQAQQAAMNSIKIH